jgi:hypothetical protein
MKVHCDNNIILTLRKKHDKNVIVNKMNGAEIWMNDALKHSVVKYGKEDALC